jgi:hypothetical protein
MSKKDEKVPRGKGSRFVKFAVGTCAVVVALGVGVAAWSYFTSTAQGVASFPVSTLNPPTNVVATFPNPDVRTVDVSWSAASQVPGLNVDGYYVQRELGSATQAVCGSSPSSLITTLSCQDSNVNSSAYTYVVTAVFHSWHASSTSNSVTVPAPVLTTLDVSPTTSSPTAGVSFGVGLSGYDQYGVIDTNYTGTQCVTFGGSSKAPGGRKPSYPTNGSCSGGSAVTFVHGVATGVNAAPVTLYDAQTTELTATDAVTSILGESSVTVAPHGLNSFTVTSTNSTPMAGGAFSVGLTAYDSYGNVDTSYTGNQCLTFSGALNAPDGAEPTYPSVYSCGSHNSSVTFTNGLANVPVQLYDAQDLTLSATDVASGHYGWISLSVVPAALDTFHVMANAPATAGNSFGLALTGYDQYGNLDTNYTGSHCVVFSGPADAPDGTAPTYPGGPGCSKGSALTFNNGTANGSSIVPVTLYDAEAVSLVATDVSTSSSGSVNITVAPAILDHLGVNAPATPTAGISFNVGLTAYDQYNNVDTNYTGSQCVAFSGPSISPGGTAPGYPGGSCSSGSSVNFTNGLATGVSAPSITLYDSESVNLAATDVPSGSAGSASIEVGANALSTFDLSSTTTPTAGTPFSVVLTADDKYGNVTTNYSGNQCIIFSGPDNAPNGRAPDYPAYGSCSNANASQLDFVAGVASGANAANVSLYDAENTTLTATEQSTNDVGTLALTVSAGANVGGIQLAQISQNASPPVVCVGPTDAVSCTSTGEGTTVGETLTASLQLVDAFGNTFVNQTGAAVTVDLAATGQGIVSPMGPGTLSVSNGQSTTTNSFTLVHDDGVGNTVSMTATLDETGQTLTITLIS